MANLVAHKKLIILILGIALIFGGSRVLWGGEKTVKPEETETASSAQTKEATVVTFGKWQSDGYREVLATIGSSHEVEVQAEVSGNLETVLVKIGDRVKKGQLLASFRRSDDATQINYENAILSRDTMALSVKNSIKSAETAVANAKRTLEQTERQQEQAYQLAFENLTNRAKNIDTTLLNSLDYIDRILGGSLRYRYETTLGRNGVGGRDRVKKQKAKSQIERLVLRFQALPVLNRKPNEAQIIAFSQGRVDFANDLSATMRLLDELIRNSILSTTFSETDRQGIETQNQTLKTKLETEILTLKGEIEGAKNTREQTSLGITNVEDAVLSAQAALDLKIAEGETQMSSLENQLRVTGSSRLDLEVRAPLTGIVSDKSARAGRFVSAGTELFTVINDQANKKVVAFLTPEEWKQVQKSQGVKVKLDNDQIVSLTRKSLSVRVDGTSQKVKAEFLLPDSDILIGTIVKLLVPIGGGDDQNTLPLSAIAFEPEGAEVLVLKDGITMRRQIVTGALKGEAVPILEGLEPGEQVIRWRNRFFAGEKINGVK